MLNRLKDVLDPYILALLGTVALASVVPARGGFAAAAGVLANAGVVLLFFLHGAKLSRAAIVAGAGHWRLHLAVLAATFAVFPVFGLGLAALPGLAAPVAAGILFLTLLPSTVQSSIAFTSIARGNVAAAVCAASFSNLIGIVLTPLLVTVLLGHAAGGMPWGAAEKIVLQLLVPFVLGHLAAPLVGPFVARHRHLVTYVDRGSILLVVYTAFSAAVVEGLWQYLPITSLAVLVALCAGLLAAVMTVTWLAGRAWFDRDDAIVLLFCGSKKSLASGVPMASVLFPAAQVGAVLLPLMLFHQIQLIACAVIARHYAAQANRADRAAA